MGGPESIINSGAQLLGAINGVKEAVDKLKEGLDSQFIPGIQAINDSIASLASGAKATLDGMEEYQKGQTAYRQGLVKYVEGVGDVADGLDALSGNLTRMFTGMDSLVKVLEKMDEGLSAMDSQGLSEMEEGIIQAIDDMRFAKALKQRMEELADGYRSFMDNERNKNSSVQFIMRTREIAYEEEAKEAQDVQDIQPKMNLWERLLDLLGL